MKKYEEMTKEELCREADKILKRFQISCMDDGSTIWNEDVCNLGKIVKMMKEYETNNTKFIHKNITKVLCDFLERNKDYIVDAYLRNLSTNNLIEQMCITTDRTFKTDDKKFILKWNYRNDTNLNDISLIHDEILVCYEEVDEYNQQTIHVILKCGIAIEFSCCGLVMDW